MGDAARALREGMIVELFGDAEKLLERLEALDHSLTDKIREAPRLVSETARAAAGAIESSASTEREKWSKEAREVTNDLMKLGRAVSGQSRALLQSVVLAGLLSGALGSIATAILIAKL
ncbi:MAG: hypothetical protein Q8R98_18180 [Rubrivivax sp.]|nr:hypothetical protein [Rubrivivax sp.]